MKKLKVDPIKDGTVIDHIPAQKVLRVLSIIKPSGEDIVTVGMNFASKKYGRKDIVKIENRELTPEEVNNISLIAPTAQVIIIRNFKVVQKNKVQIPEKIKNLSRCANPRCITNNEDMATRFTTVAKRPVKVRCDYCERVFLIDELPLE